MQEVTLISLPVGETTRFREEAVGSRLIQLNSGDTLIRPGQKVEMLYQLLEGEVAMIRDLGTSKEARTPFSRTEVDSKDPKGWTPFLGSRYLFTKRASSMHYVAVTSCIISEISPALIRGLYYKRDCVKLVRELIRNSDMPMAMFHRELDARFASLGYAGFRKEVLPGLLMIEDEHLMGDAETRAHGRKVVHEEYSAFACDMIFRLMGNDLVRGGEETNVEYVPPRRPLS